MFRLKNEPGKIDEFEDIYQKITKLSCPFSFVIVNQVCDGEGNYDVFRMSEQSFTKMFSIGI